MFSNLYVAFQNDISTENWRLKWIDWIVSSWNRKVCAAEGCFFLEFGLMICSNNNFWMSVRVTTNRIHSFIHNIEQPLLKIIHTEFWLVFSPFLYSLLAQSSIFLAIINNKATKVTNVSKIRTFFGVEEIKTDFLESKKYHYWKSIEEGEKKRQKFISILREAFFCPSTEPARFYAIHSAHKQFQLNFRRKIMVYSLFVMKNSLEKEVSSIKNRATKLKNWRTLKSYKVLDEYNQCYC